MVSFFGIKKKFKRWGRDEGIVISAGRGSSEGVRMVDKRRAYQYCYKSGNEREGIDIEGREE